MPRNGNCYDNCVIEIFFDTMKNEMFYGQNMSLNHQMSLNKRYRNMEYYNNKRITTKLKGLTPTMYRHQSFNPVQSI